jgi:hypothetical protein
MFVFTTKLVFITPVLFNKITHINSSKIDPHNYIEYETNENTSTITLRPKSNDGIASAKALVQLLSQDTINLANYKNIIIKINNQDFQFLSFYTRFAPQNINKSLTSKSNLKVVFTNKNAALGLLDAIANSNPDKLSTI